MKLMRDLSDEEIINIAKQCKDYGQVIRELEFARAILDAAWIKEQDPLKDGK